MNPLRKSKLLLKSVVFTVTLFCAGVAQANVVIEYVTRSNPPVILWDKSKTEIFLDPKDPTGNPFVIVSGTYTDKKGTLLHQFKRIKLDENSYFAIPVEIKDTETKISVTSVNMLGVSNTDTIKIVFKDLKQYLENARKPKNVRVFVQPWVGYSAFSYKETLTPSFFENTLSFRLIVNYNLPANLGLAFQGDYVAVPFSTSLSGVNATFFELNLTASYRLALQNSPFSFKLNLGAFFSSMSVTDNLFGFSNMLGPQAVLTVYFRLTSKDQLSIYGKYEPVVAGDTVPFTSYQVAAGIGYSRGLSPKQVFSTTLGFSKNYSSFQNVLFTDLWITTFSVGLGLNFF